MLNPFKSNTVSVCWTPYFCGPNKKDNYHNPFNEIQILFTEPQPLLKEISRIHKDKDFIACPSMLESCRNVFVINAPMDADITIATENNTMFVTGHGWSQEYYDSFCRVQSGGVVSIPPTYVFYSTEPVIMEMLPVFLLPSTSIENTMFVPGSMDISKWIRPVDFSFVVRDPAKPITIRRGEPLMFVRFTTKNKQKVVLERVESTSELNNMVHSCAMLKHRVTGLKLPELYNMAKLHIDRFLGRKVKKCPFHWGK